jgi:hypothetical protein
MPILHFSLQESTKKWGERKSHEIITLALGDVINGNLPAGTVTFSITSVNSGSSVITATWNGMKGERENVENVVR